MLTCAHTIVIFKEMIRALLHFTCLVSCDYGAFIVTFSQFEQRNTLTFLMSAKIRPRHLDS